MVTSAILKVHYEDKEKLNNECRELFLQNNPKLTGMKLSQAFMFKKLVEYYLE